MRASRDLPCDPGNDETSGWDDRSPDLIDELEDELRTKTRLLENRDYEGLVSYLERVVLRRPEDAFSLKDLGEALVLAGRPARALELLAPLHGRHPSFEDVQFVLLDALFALGRDEASFDWVEQPAVVRLDAMTLDRCHSHLALRAAVDFVANLYDELLLDGYLAFDEERLRHALQADERFVVEGDRVRLADGAREASSTGGSVARGAPSKVQRSCDG